MKSIVCLLLILATTALAQTINVGTITFTPDMAEAANGLYASYTNSIGTNTPDTKSVWLRSESSNLVYAAWFRRAVICQQQQRSEIETRWPMLAVDKRALLLEIAKTNAPLPGPKPAEGKAE